MESVISHREVFIGDNSNIKNIIINHIIVYGKECDLNHIDMKRVTDLSRIFRNSEFNGDISNWDVSNVHNMKSLFSGSIFNGDISRWNVKNVNDLTDCFLRSNFDGDLSFWDLRSLNMMGNCFLDSNLDGKEPWWYIFNHVFESSYTMMDSLDFGWVDFETGKVSKSRLLRSIRKVKNKKWNGELPELSSIYEYID